MRSRSKWLEAAVAETGVRVDHEYNQARLRWERWRPVIMGVVRDGDDGSVTHSSSCYRHSGMGAIAGKPRGHN